MTGWQFACPICQATLEDESGEEKRCAQCGHTYRCEQGIWRMLPAERQAAYSRFIREYEIIRREEGRGSNASDYYRALPYRDLSGRMAGDWHIRAESFRTLLREVVEPLEKSRGRPLHILDLGAGNGWLSYRLAERGHDLAAVDLQTNALDGLGAYSHYPMSFTPLQAEFDALPFTGGQADLIVFNASFHYSTHYEKSLSEAGRVLAPGGWLAILDTPIYHQSVSGEQMVGERQAQFTRQYGFPSDALTSENYLTYDRLDQLGKSCGLRWHFSEPDYGLKWKLRPWIARIRGSREPARFFVIYAEKNLSADSR